MSFVQRISYSPDPHQPGASVRLDVYRSDVVVVQSPGQTASPRHSQPSRRGEITEFSAKSRRRMALAFRNMLPPRIMLTLTYPADFPADGVLVKRHLHALFERLRRRGVTRWAWFLEFQRRGAPHFHIFLWDRVPAKWVAQAWFEVVGSGDEKHLRAGVRVEGLRHQEAAARYATKYALKPYQKHVPESYRNVGRFWGMSRSVRPRPVVLWANAWADDRMSPGCEILPVLRRVVRTVRRWLRSRGYRPRGPSSGRGFMAFDASGVAMSAWRYYA